MKISLKVPEFVHRGKYFSAIGALSLLIEIFFCAGCSTQISIRKQDPGERRLYSVADFSTGTLNGSTVNLLSNYQLSGLYRNDPDSLISQLEQLYRNSGEAGAVASLADTALQFGYRFRDDPDRSSRFFLAASLYSCLYLKHLDDRSDLYNEQRIRLMRIYNLASTELFCFLKARALERKCSFSLAMPGSGRIVSFSAPVYDLPLPVQNVEEFFVCADFKTENLTHDTRVFGLGIPLVAQLRKGCLDPRLGIPLPGMPVAVTVLVDFEHDMKTNSVAARLLYVYSRTTTKVTLGKRFFPLARDFSTPLARAVAMNQKIHFLRRTLKVEQGDSFSGLYLFEPYDEKRIPVVFVHGLMSDITTWGQMLNTLLHDPLIRERYQFLGFAYSSGNPILISSSRLHRELHSLRQKLVDHSCSTEFFDKMVLVGHSMGGLLSRFQISYCTPEKTAEILGINARGQIRSSLDPKTAEKLEKLISFQPGKFIRRVVFIAVPHRGSEIARSWIGTFGSRMIELPLEIIRSNVELIRQLVKTGKLHLETERPWTGIDDLRPDAPVLKLLNQLKMAEGVPFHSIIGNRKKAFTPGGTDGIVPYWSSHLDHAESELIVRSGHSAHQAPLAIQELRRILRKHAASVRKEHQKGK